MAQQQRDEVEARVSRLREVAATSRRESAIAQQKAIEAQRQEQEAQLAAEQWQQQCQQDEAVLQAATVEARAVEHSVPKRP